jgi:predicted polyphosphate/ATP-dependent NAD kinase
MIEAIRPSNWFCSPEIPQNTRAGRGARPLSCDVLRRFYLNEIYAVISDSSAMRFGITSVDPLC